MRRRRRQFASSFVITVACGGGKPADVVTPESMTPMTTPRAYASAPVDSTAVVAPTVDAGQDPKLVGKIRFVDRWCEKVEPSGEILRVTCPDELMPEAPPGELIVSNGGYCFRVYERKFAGRSSRHEWDEGQVRCPPGGPNVKLPVVTVVGDGPSRYQLDGETLTCSREVASNPPYMETGPCPSQLLPRLVGLAPDAACQYQGVQFACGPVTDDPYTGGSVPAGLKARIIALNVTSNGTEITISRGTRDGLAKGVAFRLGKYRGTLARCNERTCTAIVKLTPDQIKDGNPDVEF